MAFIRRSWGDLAEIVCALMLARGFAIRPREQPDPTPQKAQAVMSWRIRTPKTKGNPVEECPDSTSLILYDAHLSIFKPMGGL